MGPISTGPTLTWAELSRANFTRADLRGVNLNGAKLCNAKLIEADLVGASFFMADLEGADLNHSICGVNTFTTIDISGVKGLETIVHKRPSAIGTDTLLLSKGRIPKVFLRGCGVPDPLIEYLPSLIRSMSPIQFHSCFISHSSKDQLFAARLHSRMVQEKIPVWYAPEDMRAGQKQYDQIDQAIQVSDKFLLALSMHSIQSPWIETELRTALRREEMRTARSYFRCGWYRWRSCKPGSVSTRTPGKTWLQKSASITYQTSQIGKTTTHSRPRSPACSTTSKRSSRSAPATKGIHRSHQPAVTGRDPPRDRCLSSIRYTATGLPVAVGQL